MTSHTINISIGGTTRSIESPLQTTVWQSGRALRNCVIALHGFGDNAQNFISVAQELGVEDTLFIAPSAPFPVPMNMGGAQWYNLFNTHLADLETSRARIETLILNLSEGLSLPLSKIFLLGFSQGALLSLHTALRMKEPLAGICALSGFLIQSHTIPSPLPEGIKNTPVFLAHGMQDQVVFPYSHFETLDILQKLGFNRVESRTYPMAHNVSQTELHHIKTFIEAHR